MSNPFRLVKDLPRRRGRQLGLGLLGAVLLMAVVHRVDGSQFRQALVGLRWSFLVACLFVGAAAIALRALRLTLLLGVTGGFTAVFRSVALGYLGMIVLPLGGGEVLKMATLKALLEVPAPTVATAWLLDRGLDVLGLAGLLCLLAGMGAGVPLRSVPPRSVLWVLGLALTGLGVLLALGRPVLRARQPWQARLAAMVGVLAALKRPAHLARILGLQGLITALDVLGIWVGFQAFAFGPGLSWLTPVRLAAYVQIGAALPLLPGGLGTHQAACVLALAPAGVTASKAFAYSLVATGTGFAMLGFLGILAALWPDPPPGSRLG